MPKGVYERSKTQEVSEVSVQPQVTETPIQNVPRGTTTKIRQYSTNKDHMGEGEPLCHGCGHRADMHYVERRWVERRMAKNLQGDIGEIEVQNREKVYTGARPCNHACLCKEYQ